MAKRHSAFTLIEILIVVIILGILAAIVIPQFSSASEDAKKGAAMTTQASVRAQLQLWKLQHNDNYPTLIQLASGAATEWDVLTKKTDVDGALNVAGACGAYLQAKPVNQINGFSTIATTDATVLPGVEPTVSMLNVNTSGWLYDVATGRIWATLKK